MKPTMLTLRPHEAATLARGALAAIGAGDIPILMAAHIRITDRFDEGETGYLVDVTTTDRYSLHHVTFATTYTLANGPGELTLPADALQWLRDHAYAYGQDAQITLSCSADEYTITILKGVRGTERMTRKGTPPRGKYPDVASLVVAARTAAAAPIELHRYQVAQIRTALGVLNALDGTDSDRVTFKQTAPIQGRKAGALLITLDGPFNTWEILIQPAEGPTA